MKRRVDKKVTIEKLANIVAKGFSDVTSNMASKDELEKVANRMARKDDLYDLATKKELIELRDDLEQAMSRHLGTFRKDYDDLARRVKKLEEKIL